jgi:large subunit ribosomal protein L24
MEHKVKEVKNVNVRVGDEVVVIAGKDIGKKGKVTAVNPETNRCIVSGVNMITKHKKARSQGQKAERKKLEGSVDISNVQILCAKCDKATRVGHAEVSGIRHRVCKKCGAVLDKKYIKAKTKDKAEDKKEEAKEEKAAKKPLQRREVKHTAESTIKKPAGAKVSPSTKLPRKMGGE